MLEPGLTLRKFYMSVMSDDLAPAIAVTSQRFHLVPPGAWGVNVNAGDPSAIDAAIEHLADRIGAYSATPVTGDITQLLNRVRARCQETFPASAWEIESLTVDGDAAEAVTTDGSSGLIREHDGVWRILWTYA